MTYNIDRLVGVEMECSEYEENYELPKSPYWDKHEDQSVDDFGAEYTFLNPLKGKDVEYAIDALIEHLESNGAQVHNVGAGFHLHLDFSKSDADTAIRFVDAVEFIYQYILPEVSAARRNNSYCQPYSREMSWHKPSQVVVDRVKRYHGVSNLNAEELVRYYDRFFWIHPQNMQKHDIKTVEVRLHHATVNKNEIMTWIELWSELANKFEEGLFTEITSPEEFNRVLDNLNITKSTKERFYRAV